MFRSFFFQNYPTWALAIGWLITASSLLPPVIYAIVFFIRTPGDLKTVSPLLPLKVLLNVIFLQRLKQMFRPGYTNPNLDAARRRLEESGIAGEKPAQMAPLLGEGSVEA